MSLFKFLTSKTFLKQVLLALVAVSVLCFIMLQWLKSSTNHGDFETVPNLTGKSISVADIELKENNLVDCKFKIQQISIRITLSFQLSSKNHPQEQKLRRIEKYI